MDMDPAVLRQLALGAIPPGIVATLYFALLWWFKRGKTGAVEPPLLHRLATPWFFVVFYGIAHALLFGGLNMPPRQGTDWLPLMAAGGAALATAIAVWRTSVPPKRWVALALVALLGFAALALIGYLGAGTMRSNWTRGEAARHILPFAGLSLVALAGAEVLTRCRSGAAPVTTLLMTAAGAASVLMLGFNSMKLGQAAGLAAAFFGGAMVIGLVRPRLSLAGGGAVAPVLLILAALYHGALFTYTARPWLLIGLVAAALPAAALATLPFAGPSLPLWKRVLPPLVALLPLAAAMAVILSQDSGGYEYE